LLPHFSITDDMGNPAIEARGHFGVHHEVTFVDGSGQEVAKLKKHLLTNRYDVELGGSQAAEIKHEGLFGEHFEIRGPAGVIEARGHFAMWDYSMDSAGAHVARVSRHPSLHEKFVVEIAPGQNDVFILACVMAIDDIHKERKDEHHDRV
jgi:uncharacterized protein YxjI